MNCTPIEGEMFRFHVKSMSQPGIRMVDLIEHCCSCPDFTCRHKKYTASTGRPYTCKHIAACWESVHEGIRQRYRTK